MKITAAKTKIKKQSRKISDMISELRKQFFELEIMQSDWEVRNGKARKYPSANTLIAEVTKGL